MHIVRTIILLLLFLASLVNFLPVPSKETWYVGIAVPEFPWVFMFTALLMLFWSCYAKKWRRFSIAMSALLFIIFTSPIVRAYNVGSSVDENLESSFGIHKNDIAG